jgi:nitrile hydratase accessory protein
MHKSKPPWHDAPPLGPGDDDGPVFSAPWQAQAFAMTVRLHEQGCFTWQEWAECLAAEIAAAGDRGDPDLGDTYYEHWLAALEKIVTAKDLVTSDGLVARKVAWDRAARATPHGRPITLSKGDLG